jgi:ATP-binding cassette subfamily F protein 3
MNAIQLSRVRLVLGAHEIFNIPNWEIQAGQRIGLIGPNGAGKSSLLRLIAGSHDPEPGGSVTRAKGVWVGYLAQDPELDAARPVLQSVLAANTRLIEVEAQIAEVERRMADPQVYGEPKTLARALERQQVLLQEFDGLDGATYETRARDVLRGLDLPEAIWSQPIGRLSGGQKKLVGLAQLMLIRPPVLLLDEPDNHLDLAGKVYLERLIRDYDGTVVIISHDRYLLDAVVTHIAEIEDGRLTTFSGDYSAYVSDKERRLARQDELYRVQQREIGRLEAAAKRYAIWAKQYDNEDFARRAQNIQRRIERIDRIEQPVLERRRMLLELNGWRGSSQVLVLDGVSKTYERLPVLHGVDLVVRHGERVGLIGANGAGKSVLVRLILGTENADQGDIRIGPSVRTGYYAQEHDTLDFGQTPIDALRRAARITEGSAVAYLNRFLFSYRQVSQRIGDLSGGERSRLQLALLAAPNETGPNFLLLDEPTNNLDIASAEALEEALAEFNGTVLVISHDRYFLDRVVQRLIVLEAGRLTEHVGTYSDYAARAAQ